MQPKNQIGLIICVLIVIGVGSALYKKSVLGFSFFPVPNVAIWTVEAEVNYQANGGETEISINLPDSSRTLTVLETSSITSNHDFSIKEKRAEWVASDVKGPQRLFLRATIARLIEGELVSDPALELQEEPFSEAGELAAAEIIQEAVEAKSVQEKAARILSLLNSSDNQNGLALYNEAEEYGGKLQMACGVLARADIPAGIVNGLRLTTTKTTRSLSSYILIGEGKNYYLINPRSAEEESLDDFLLWKLGKESLLEIVGGENGKVSFSVMEGKLAAERVAVMHGKYTSSPFIDFSIYSLPVRDQNTFKLLLLIPIGALVVVILRNLVGIPTSGTFMPILLALVFLQTKLVSGLVLFLVVVSLGLLLRSYLSHLNLLLVPRISAVLVFVILIYIFISVTSHKLGLAGGMQVTFFPMIIISWTIERLSVLWEEEGPRDVLKQGGGSLFAASLIYFAMSNSYVEHLTFSFPELLLVVLAVIIMIGSYSGYRLTELRRFEPLASSGREG